MQGPLRATKYFMPQGRLMMAEKDPTTGEPMGFIHVGNAVDIKASLNVSTIDKKEAMTGQFGLAAQFENEKGVNFSFTLESFHEENLAMALRANITTIGAGTAADKPIKLYKGKEMVLPHIKATVTEITSADGATTYVAGTDYIAYDNSVLVPAASGALATADTGDGVDVLVTYSYPAQKKVDSFTTGQKSYWFWLDAIDAANDLGVKSFHFYKVNPQPLKELLLISSEPGNISIEGACMLDETRPSGTSKFFSYSE